MNFAEYFLDYTNFKCKKRLIDELSLTCDSEVLKQLKPNLMLKK